MLIAHDLRHDLLLDPERLLALAFMAARQAQRSADHDPETREQHALRAAVGMLLDDDPTHVLDHALKLAENRPELALGALLLERMAWHLASALDFDQNDGTVVRQRTFAIPIIVPGDDPVPLCLTRRGDQKALHAIATTLSRHGFVRENASVTLLPYLYPAHALRSMTAAGLRRLSLLLRATHNDEAPSFDPKDERWCCNLDAAVKDRAQPPQDFEGDGGAPVRLFFLIGAIADEPEHVDEAFDEASPQHAPIRQTHLEIWSDTVAMCINRWLGLDGTFVSVFASPCDALNDVEHVLPSIHCSMTLEHEMQAHGLLPRQLDVVATRHVCAIPKPNTVHAVHLEFFQREKTTPVFELLWRRPDGADERWSDHLIDDVQTAGVTLRNERHERAKENDVRFDPDELGVSAYVFETPSVLQ